MKQQTSSLKQKIFEKEKRETNNFQKKTSTFMDVFL